MSTTPTDRLMIHPDALDKQAEVTGWIVRLIGEAEEAGLSRAEIDNAIAKAKEEA